MGFVTADTAALLARHQPRETAHGVQTAALSVQQLEVQRYPSRGLEVHGPVYLDRYLAENAFDAFFLDDRHRWSRVTIRFVPGRIGLIVQLEHA